MDSRLGSSPIGQEAETRPLISPSHKYNIGTICFSSMLFGLAILWCITDQWNHSVSAGLFEIGDLRAKSTGQKVFPSFTYPLTLAFVQFAVMGSVFMFIYGTLLRDATASWKEIGATFSFDRRWLALVLTHIFSIFWLQALILPAQALSLGVFAISRAIEIPTSAILRIPCANAQISRGYGKTTLLAFVAAAVIYFAYVQVSGCLCVWSGYGVSLSGPTFWIIYLLVLTVPATNLVLQEGVMESSNVNPALMLGLQNMFAAAICLPVLMFANVTGWENVGAAFSMIASYPEVRMLVVWFCIQMSITSAISVGVICMTNSFWAVALRAIRVVYWWVQQLFLFYMGAAVHGAAASVSISCPHSSIWSFVMVCGLTIGGCAIYTDQRADDVMVLKKALKRRNAMFGVNP